jgi:hypothetical protein
MTTTLTGSMIAKYLKDHDSGRDTCKDVAYSLNLFLTGYGKPGCVRALVTEEEQQRLRSPGVNWIHGLRKQCVYYDRARDMLYIVPK